MTDASKEEYDPNVVESIYGKWEERGLFKPRSDIDPTYTPQPGDAYTIAFPPPNVTGTLHLGHALTAAVQDTMIRSRRMFGKNALLIPGTDHAGIATQVVVEKKVQKEEGKSRHDLGRTAFIDKVWVWTREYEKRITNQLRRTGCTFDWSRYSFSMDEPRNVATTEAFVRLFNTGKIKREPRLVNWCCALRSSISDVEVEYEEVEANSKRSVPGCPHPIEIGFMFEFKYQVSGTEDEFLVVATTRPETILGDTAVAVHPDDERYKKYHGKTVKCPFRDAHIPIVCDPILVDMSFGTGVVKVTPAHDPNDFECAKRNNLPFICVLNEDGTMNEKAGEFNGQHRYLCRKNIQKSLADLGLAVGKKGHALRVGFCHRSGDIIEPLVKIQWFADLVKEAGEAVEKVRNGELRLIPSSAQQIWEHWLQNLKPWCLSRQLWWGHQVPAWYALPAGSTAIPRDEDAARWVAARSEAEAQALAAAKFPNEQYTLIRDEDVLDTWFSASLHPFYTLKWPDVAADDFKKFYPTAVLETGHDILFFWVARMVMMGLCLTDQLPFTTVYLHAMVRDKDGEKMSKSKGNVIDPLDVMDGITLDKLQEKLQTFNLDDKELARARELTKKQFPKGIPQCGSDALRIGLLSYTVNGTSVNLDVDRIHGYRKFCNKLYNATRFALKFSLGPDYKVPDYNLTHDFIASWPLPCKWLLSRLDHAIQLCTVGLENYQFSDTVTAIYSFWLYEYCDVFIEVSKRYIKLEDGNPEKEATMYCLWLGMDIGLRLLHPMLPFLTEDLYARIPKGKVHFDTLLTAQWPASIGLRSEAVEADMEYVKEVVHGMRSLKTKLKMTNGNKPKTVLRSDAPERRALVRGEGPNIATLAYLGDVTVEEEARNPEDKVQFSVIEGWSAQLEGITLQEIEAAEQRAKQEADEREAAKKAKNEQKAKEKEEEKKKKEEDKKKKEEEDKKKKEAAAEKKA